MAAKLVQSRAPVYAYRYVRSAGKPVPPTVRMSYSPQLRITACRSAGASAGRSPMARARAALVWTAASSLAIWAPAE